MIKKLLVAGALFGMLVAGGLQLATAANSLSSCEEDCFNAWDECPLYLPMYKCNQIYQTCLQSCGG